MSKVNDFLLEVGVEELPPNSLLQLSTALKKEVAQRLEKASLTYNKLQNYITPRRLALLISDLVVKQPDRVEERRGPTVDAAYDAKGNPTKAALRFAQLCNATCDKLEKLVNAKGAWLFYKQKIQGEATKKLLPEIIQQALYALPVAKPMRWNSYDIAFIRPLHWLVMLYGSSVIHCEIFGIKAGRNTYGHRFLHPQAIKISEPCEYSNLLEKQGFVIADFNKRRDIICKQIEKLAAKCGQVIIDENLLNEITGLVEYPQALLGNIPEYFLLLPSEILISTLKKQQKCFPVYDRKNKLLPYFITISNIKSKNPNQVIKGYERVINARLTDAEFFYAADLKHPLEHYVDKLRGRIFQEKLGTMYDKTMRLINLSAYIAKLVNVDVKQAKYAARLAKADLVTSMVAEFPELQGIMGYYYALRYREPEQIAIALKEQYMPRFAADELPQTILGTILAVADRIDTLVGIFAIKNIPTGEKDPFGLRRAALGILRIIIDKQLDIDLHKLTIFAIENYKDKSIKVDVKVIGNFLFDRLRTWYLDKGVAPQVFTAVLARYPTKPFDFHKRIEAVNHFQKLPQAESLAIANKRVSNILKKSGKVEFDKKIDNKLLLEPAEIKLAAQLSAKEKQVKPLYKSGDYSKALTILATLKASIDDFFDQVMVMTDDKRLCANRLALLNKLRQLFLHVADISLLQ